MISIQETSTLLKKLVTISSPYFEESEIMDYAKGWLCQRGIDAKIHHYHEAKATGFHGRNVIAEITGSQPGPTICLNGHLDSVKLCNGWTRDPMGETDGDKLYGLGALDMKSGCAAMMIAVQHFVYDHGSFRGKILLSLVSVEEGPFGMGTNALIEEGFFGDVDFSVIAEPSAGFTGNAFPTICLGARGGYGLDVEFYGKSAHAASPEKGISAIEDAAKVVVELGNIQYKVDPHLGKGSCCVVSMASDGGACSVPDFASLKLFWHIVVGEGPDTITREIEKAVERAGISGRYQIKFREAPSEGSKGFMPFTVEKDEPMVSKFMESILRVSGKEPAISYFNSIGDFCYLGTRVDAPAVIFGAAGRNYHGSDEYVLLDSVHKTAKTIYDFLENTLLHQTGDKTLPPAEPLEKIPPK